MIFLAAAIIYTQFSSLSLSELYVASYEKPTLEVVNVRSLETDEIDNLGQVEIQNQVNIEFNNSNYGIALEILEDIPDSEKTPSMKYCAALSYMEINEFEKAKELWLQFEEVDDIVWQERSKWYLALCYLHAEDRNQAIMYLEEVSLIGGEFSENAEELIKKVR
jgi:tetratricopeptide (TPR) repeat protein